MPGSGLSNVLLQKSQRLLLQVRADKDAEAVHLIRCHRPDAVKLADGHGFDEGGPHRWPYDELAVGFAVKYSREYDEALRDPGTPTVWLVEEAFESRMAAASYARRPALSTDAVVVQGA
jgi:hypothetical protein